MRRAELVVAHTWDGHPLPSERHARVGIALGAQTLEVRVDAPFHDDPPPPQAAGSTDGLWNHEVVELFLLGDDERYLELELGPHGHHLVLQLHGVRRVVEQGLPLDYRAQPQGERWTGVARTPARWLPPGLRAANAYAIHGVGDTRQYAACHPVPGPLPDFHRLGCFGPLFGSSQASCG